MMLLDGSDVHVSASDLGETKKHGVLRTSRHSVVKTAKFRNLEIV